MSDIQTLTTKRMEKSISALHDDLNAIRTGRASAAIFEKVRVDYFGTPTPLSQVATISIPEARSVLIQPWDKGLINEIEKGIQTADLGLNPSNDGKVVRIAIPALTADRRKELVKQAKNIAEQSRVAIRNIRRDANDDLKKLQKNGDMTEDQLKTAEENIQKSTDKFITDINKILEDKEKEILEG
jgi:ribosome recycling factor